MKKGVTAFILAVTLILSIVGCERDKSGSSSAPTSADVTSPTTSFTFSKAFPDIVLASEVAEKLNKSVDDQTSEDELASITGELSVINYETNGEFFNCKDLTGIGYLKGLSSFTCCKNSVTEIPDEIGKLENLKVLNFGKAYELTTISPEIGKLRNLEVMDLFFTNINELPKEIGNLKNLKTLSLGSSKLTQLPEEIGNLTSLEILYIDSTRIKKIPESICNLSNLKALNMSHLGLTSLPENIGNLTKLERLNLFNNDLKSLPRSMEKMKSLNYLNVYDNFNLSEDYKSFISITTIGNKAEIQLFLQKFFEIPLGGIDLNNLSDSDTFNKCMSIMVKNKEYSKEGDEFFFASDKINEYARMYCQKKKFSFIRNDNQFRYDADKKGFLSTLEFGILDVGPERSRTIEVTDAKIVGGKIEVLCVFKLVYKDAEYSQYNETIDYKIVLEEDHSAYSIVSVNKL